jgi:ABC-type multidrug transport system fused ATPase/permease subunit
MQQNRADIFKEQESHFTGEANTLDRKYQQLSLIRILSFVAAIVLLFYLANARLGWAVGLLAILFPILFVFLIFRHKKLKFARDLSRLKATINTEELDRLQNKLKAFPDGLQYFKPLHPYHLDLDIFGPHSLFQVVNRTATLSGEQLLARWLSKPAPIQEIKARQQAVQELDPQLQWRQTFEAAGRHFKDPENNTEPLLSWLQSPQEVRNNKFYRIAFYIFPAISLLLLLGFIFLDLNIYFFIGSFVVNLLIVSRVMPVANATQQATTHSVKVLKAYQALIRQVEDTSFQSPLLQQLQHTFKQDDYKASAKIKDLSQILDGLDARTNQLYFLLNGVFMLDIYWMVRAERWKEEMRADIGGWFGAISEFDTLNSLAGFSFARPDYSFPELEEGSQYIETEGLGHPLLPAKNRVTNNFRMKGAGEIILITGSNMAGKSTFLRTVGVNIVLALMGAPVCARKAHLSPMQVFTSMRTQDSLEESVSSFYAELQRLRQLLKLVHAETAMSTLTEDMPDTAHDQLTTPDVAEELPVLFMLDEILKGTNSEDRHRGAEALIKQLSRLGASGFVSTHDLTLGQMAEHGGIQNYSFNSDVVGDSIRFRYKLEPGICQSFNASKLMQKMGIDIEA